jgi:hypothetical protein
MQEERILPIDPHVVLEVKKMFGGCPCLCSYSEEIFEGMRARKHSRNCSCFEESQVKRTRVLVENTS